MSDKPQDVSIPEFAGDEDRAVFDRLAAWQQFAAEDAAEQAAAGVDVPDEHSAMSRDEYERLTEAHQAIQFAIREAADECGIISAADEGENALRFFDLATDAALAAVLPVVRRQIADEIEALPVVFTKDQRAMQLQHALQVRAARVVRGDP